MGSKSLAFNRRVKKRREEREKAAAIRKQVAAQRKTAPREIAMIEKRAKAAQAARKPKTKPTAARKAASSAAYKKVAASAPKPKSRISRAAVMAGKAVAGTTLPGQALKVPKVSAAAGRASVRTKPAELNYARIAAQARIRRGAPARPRPSDKARRQEAKRQPVGEWLKARRRRKKRTN